MPTDTTAPELTAQLILYPPGGTPTVHSGTAIAFAGWALFREPGAATPPAPEPPQELARLLEACCRVLNYYDTFSECETPLCVLLMRNQYHKAIAAGVIPSG